MPEPDIIEAIARRWFLRASSPPLRDEVWDRQPDDIKDMHRERARRFWDKPSAAKDAVEAADYAMMCARGALGRKLEYAL